MIVALDSSAAVCLILPHAASGELQKLVDQADEVVVSALCRAEVSVAVDSSAPTRALAERSANQLGQIWERFWTVPVDQECLDVAADLAAGHQLPLSPAIHLAAFNRVERPLLLATFDQRQVAPALSLGLEIVELDVASSAHDMLAAD